ncbi:histidine kinase dimerization/phospho-acceptor domain-containing protein [Coprococcus comes]|uniref:histidine kinase dimerization/phospho-acceptor domain-containing protein n=1 Tax=Coprococcus comes TaxID=410072 RepID=UPI00156ED0EA|nr:histidine kinase dimerization/phospho-acceptor domain-containing protein [Coprococcus comes]NSG33352.1 sensor histidine kinase [Coprococcus comes]
MNNKWYQSAPCKGLLIILEHILAVVMITCLVFTFSYPGDDLAGILFEKPHKKYDQSKGFTDKLMSAANDITAAEGYDSHFETEGKYDENRIVDLKEYDSDRMISNENVNGLAYRLGDLVNYWENDQEMYYADGTKMADGDNDEEIIVCQKDDGTHLYYYEKEFRREFKNGNLQFGNMDEAKDEYSLESTGEVIDSMINGWVDSSASIYRNILDSENRQVYTKCWRYDGEKVSEKCAPVGAENLLEIVNKDSRWNGKLSDAMSMLGNTVDSIRDEFLIWQYVTEEYKEGNTNLAYMIVDLDNKKVYTNRLAYQKFDEWEKNLDNLKKLGVYAVATPKLTEYRSNIDMDGSQWKSLIGGNMWTDNYECVFAVDTSYPIQDDFYQESKIYQEYAPQVRFTFWIAIATGFAMLVILAWLTIVAGRSNREEGIVLNRIDKMKTEIFILLSVAVMVTCIYGEISLSYSLLNGVRFSGDGFSDTSVLIFAGIVAVSFCMTGLTLWLGMVRRIKAKTLWKNSILCLIIKYVRIGIRHLGEVWKAAILFGVLVVVHWIAIAMWEPGIWLFVMLAAEAGAFFYLMRRAIGRARIIKGVKAIADGQVDYQIPLNGLKGGQLEAAVSINKIGDGLDRAVEESVKNERLKTDLITNVSHDIKTPLTSIINYVELLKREDFEDPKIRNYLQVLEEKAYRLKTLTEDVVEAFKVSSGNISLEMMNLNLVELVNQTCAEFEEKFEARNLKMIMNLPAEPATIYADGRRMWRVLANVFNNAAKYAMEGSRVYVDLVQTGEEVQLTIKNVSEQPLNISADELTERFIRGDVSSSTEGSGLGLSIAQNLTKLQGGKFELYLDGDLFKVLICFPVPKETEDVYQEVEQ